MKIFAAVLFVSLGAIGAFAPAALATTWIGTVSDLHCGPDHKGLQGDPTSCLVFIAADKEVYNFDNPAMVQPHVGHEVSITGSLNPDLTVGVTYESQGILHVDTVTMLRPVELSEAERQQFRTWMKGMQPQLTAVRNAIVKKDDAAAAAEATKLAGQFDPVVEFWKKHNDPDALAFATSARDAAKSIATAKNLYEHEKGMQKVNAACAGCHLGHRGGKPGAFKVVQ